ncbi:nitroreductase/quinone reductase family protein [Antrihabitans stalactiti]|uniref:Nitroreductase family deazaflavin-dependent oxidoreductase n=1 Tax=Antrihabitans stalactiti TaxID=2584121 RepID=A0A848KGI9_9NOCA|nr:nitroreductase/quinone reductase family protein [Antrihabitans stalactiti]NMN98123.1 nitroreductase family deazaflavin-dependent oxidoreductase [Antrihabitans stalactiti]
MTEKAFPDVRWHRARPRLKKALTAFGSTRAGSWWIRTVTPLDRALLARSKGRMTMFGPTGIALILLTTTGRKSGLPRTTPLIYTRDGDRLFVVGSNFGQAGHPTWTANLLANPEAIVTMAGKEIPVIAELITGAEWDRAFATFSDYTHAYDAYLDRTDRTFRIFALTAR